MNNIYTTEIKTIKQITSAPEIHPMTPDAICNLPKIFYRIGKIRSKIHQIIEDTSSSHEKILADFECLYKKDPKTARAIFTKFYQNVVKEMEDLFTEHMRKPENSISFQNNLKKISDVIVLNEGIIYPYDLKNFQLHIPALLLSAATNKYSITDELDALRYFQKSTPLPFSSFGDNTLTEHDPIWHALRMKLHNLKQKQSNHTEAISEYQSILENLARYYLLSDDSRAKNILLQNDTDTIRDGEEIVQLGLPKNIIERSNKSQNEWDEWAEMISRSIH